MNPTELTLLNTFEKYEKWILDPLAEDVRRQDRSQFNVFIVISAAIDNLASIRFLGEISHGAKDGVSKRYRKFIREYFHPKYAAFAKRLYTGFRCKLIHEFQLKGFDIRQDLASRSSHLSTDSMGNVCINSECLYEDLMSSFVKLREDMVGPKAKSEIVGSFSKTGHGYWFHT